MDYSQHTTDELKEMLSSIFKRGKAGSKRFEFFRKNRQLEMIDEITAEIKRREDATE